jgi:predicted transposase/invertase (TIGR01784 family)
MHFVDPRNNFAFHKIFGNPKRPEVLPGFLNAVLSPEFPIVKVTVQNPYQESRLVELKDTVVDVRATDSTGAEYIVEMQVERQQAWAQRALYYTSKAVVGQLQRGELYDKLRPAFFIGVLDFKLEPEKPDWPWFTRYKLREETTREGYPLDFQLNFIELPRFKKALEAVATDVEAWTWFFKNTADLEEAPEALLSRPGMKAAFAEANALGWTPLELDDYERVAHAIAERVLREQNAEARGIEKGREEGREEGRTAALKELADSWRQAGKTDAEIASLLGLADGSAPEHSKLKL